MAEKKFRLVHKLRGFALVIAGDLACRVANDRAHGNKQILEDEFLRVLEPSPLQNSKFFIEEVLTH